jgi:hypothetical protein
MARRKKKLGWRAQVIIVWFVTTSLVTFGLLHLRATGRLSDRFFQPIALVLCRNRATLETDFAWVSTPSPSFDRPSLGSAMGPAATLKSVECVTPAGARRPVRGFVPLLWLAVALPVGVPLVISVRRGIARQKTQKASQP